MKKTRLLLGAAIGAASAYFFDPNNGKRRRAAAKQRLNEAFRGRMDDSNFAGTGVTGPPTEPFQDVPAKDRGRAGMLFRDPFKGGQPSIQMWRVRRRRVQPSTGNGTATGLVQSVPNDNTTMADVLRGYAEAGFTGEFSCTANGILCHSCESELPAREFATLSVRRLEGASDPADMNVVVATECPRCGARGVLVLGYGPAADPQHSDVLAAMQDRRETASLPSDASPSDLPR
jgi:hypothetical protein